MSVSSPFCAPSRQVGAAHSPSDPQIFDLQSAFFVHSTMGGTPPSIEPMSVSVLVLLVPHATTTEMASALTPVHAANRVIDILPLQL